MRAADILQGIQNSTFLYILDGYFILEGNFRKGSFVNRRANRGFICTRVLNLFLIRLSSVLISLL